MLQLFSMTLLKLDKSEIGLELLHRRLDSLFKTNTTFTILSGDGKIPFEKDLFITSESGKDITFLICFKILCDKRFGPLLLVVFKSWITFFTSSSEIGDVKKVFGLGHLK